MHQPVRDAPLDVLIELSGCAAFILLEARIMCKENVCEIVIPRIRDRLNICAPLKLREVMLCECLFRLRESVRRALDVVGKIPREHPYRQDNQACRHHKSPRMRLAATRKSHTPRKLIHRHTSFAQNTNAVIIALKIPLTQPRIPQIHRNLSTQSQMTDIYFILLLTKIYDRY